MKYDDANRGKIQYRDRARQIVDFSDIRYKNITPTDIDGFFEKGNKAFVFYEYKLSGVDIPKGQKLALTRLVDVLSSAGKAAVLFICRHEVSTPDEDIDAANSIVEKIYWNNRWHRGIGKTVKEHTDKFMQWVNTLKM